MASVSPTFVWRELSHFLGAQSFPARSTPGPGAGKPPAAQTPFSCSTLCLLPHAGDRVFFMFSWMFIPLCLDVCSSALKTSSERGTVSLPSLLESVFEPWGTDLSQLSSQKTNWEHQRHFLNFWELHAAQPVQVIQTTGIMITTIYWIRNRMSSTVVSALPTPILLQLNVVPEPAEILGPPETSWIRCLVLHYFKHDNSQVKTWVQVLATPPTNPATLISSPLLSILSPLVSFIFKVNLKRPQILFIDKDVGSSLGCPGLAVSNCKTHSEWPEGSSGLWLFLQRQKGLASRVPFGEEITE